MNECPFLPLTGTIGLSAVGVLEDLGKGPVASKVGSFKRMFPCNKF